MNGYGLRQSGMRPGGNLEVLNWRLWNGRNAQFRKLTNFGSSQSSGLMTENWCDVSKNLFGRHCCLVPSWQGMLGALVCEVTQEDLAPNPVTLRPCRPCRS